MDGRMVSAADLHKAADPVMMDSMHGEQDAWLKQVVGACRQKGHVQTLGGRRRYLRDIAARVRDKSAAAERQAVNTVCQVLYLSLAIPMRFLSITACMLHCRGQHLD